MPAVGEVSFELERFEWTADDRLEVVGRWNGVRGRRVSRPTLTVESGGRRQRLSGTQESDEPWSAAFRWSGEDIAGAELEIGRSLVVELPPPRRRRRRTGMTAELELRGQLDELRATVATLRAERAAAAPADALRRVTEERDALAARLDGAEEPAPGRLAAVEAERDDLAAELESVRADATRRAFELGTLREQQGTRVAEAGEELAGLRLAHGSLRAAHEALEDELEALRGVREERDELAQRLDRLTAASADTDAERARLGDVIRELRERSTKAETANERLAGELASAREHGAAVEADLATARQDATQRVETERASTTEVHARLATAREEAQRTMVAEAEETERLRAELERTRQDAERQLAAERAEVARLREELLSSEVDEQADETSRRMLERITRDLERERATSRTLKRELDTLRSETAEERRQRSSATANGTLAMDEAPVAMRGVRTAPGTQRRVEAARAGASQRVPRVPPSRYAVWAVRIGATLLVALLAVALVVLVGLVT